MKKYLGVIIGIIFLLGGCSVQKNMSSEIFINRLSEKCDFSVSESFVDESENIYFLNDKNNIEYVFVFSVNESGDVKKISFSCNDTKKAENFMNYIRQIISVYSPNEKPEEIIGGFSEKDNLKQGLNYYENQWYLYCLNTDKYGLFFSVTNKKLCPDHTVEFSLKPNDKSGF